MRQGGPRPRCRPAARRPAGHARTGRAAPRPGGGGVAAAPPPAEKAAPPAEQGAPHAAEGHRRVTE
ncbi:MAG: hypothetical protein LBP86_00850 [Azoarcus sp.]|jgi:hypothetical protein|nr:hypothetical protein [Azoarcus sp.]